jgi:hypothetical protein
VTNFSVSPLESAPKAFGTITLSHSFALLSQSQTQLSLKEMVNERKTHNISISAFKSEFSHLCIYNSGAYKEELQI